MKMEVPHILVASGSIVLARGNAFAPEDTPHSLGQATRGTKELIPEVVRDIQHVLIVAPRHHQAVAFYSGVVVKRNEREHVGVHQDNGCFRARRRQRPGNAAKRTLVAGWSILHEARHSSEAAPRSAGLDEPLGTMHAFQPNRQPVANQPCRRRGAQQPQDECGPRVQEQGLGGQRQDERELQ